MLLSNTALSASFPALPATRTRYPTLTSSGVNPRRLTMLTELVSMSHSRSRPLASLPVIEKRMCGLFQSTSVISPSISTVRLRS
jgi:hypothetical protein